jgi:hypothetical protein
MQPCDPSHAPRGRGSPQRRAPSECARLCPRRECDRRGRRTGGTWCTPPPGSRRHRSRRAELDMMGRYISPVTHRAAVCTEVRSLARPVISTSLTVKSIPIGERRFTRRRRRGRTAVSRYCPSPPLAAPHPREPSADGGPAVALQVHLRSVRLGVARASAAAGGSHAERPEHHPAPPTGLRAPLEISVRDPDPADG